MTTSNPSRAPGAMQVDQAELWGPLADRYLGNQRPRRLLALDGGGIRGILTLAILAEIERQLATRTARPDAFRLCHFFDYIGGTSTGAIIAAGLARGMTVQELTSFYTRIGPEMFQKERLLHRLRNLYRSDPLAEQLKETFGERTTLSPSDLKCLLLVVTRNVTTDSPWPVSSVPPAKYNATERADCNLKIPLWQLVRASTAAPIYFPPEVLEWEKGNAEKSFVFVDGGMTPYNNPAFLLYRMATAPEYRLGWPKGESQLMLVSVGTGSAADRGPDALQPETNVASTLVGLPGALMGGASVDQDINCRVIGRCVYGEAIDSEVGDLIPREDPTEPDSQPIPLDRDLERHFLYARYNADLSEEGLKRLNITGVDAEAVQKLDAVGNIANLIKIGEAAAKHVDLERFGKLVPQRLS
jgi:patatin-like phospholipase